MSHRNGWILAVTMACSACGAGALKVEAPGSDSTESVDTTEALLRRSSTYDLHFQAAGAEFQVPVALLKAFAYARTRYAPSYGETEFDGQRATFGIMGLSSEDITQAAPRVGVDADAIKAHTLANIRAAAALLSASADELGLKNRWQVTAWAPAIAKLSGIRSPELARAFVRDSVYQSLAKGVGAPSEALAQTDQSLTLAGEFTASAQALSASPDYSGAVWRASPNYSGGRSGGSPSVVIIHTCEGDYYGCQDWLANSAAQASAHYVVKEDGGEVVQLVRDSDRAWHIGATYNCSLNGGQLCDRNGSAANNFTVGIEHAGRAAQASWSDGLVDASTKLSCHLSRKHGIPVDRYHYVGHGQLQPYNRTDPGANWPWSKYMALVSANCGGAPVVPAVPGLAADVVSQTASNLRPIVGRPFEFKFTVKNTGSRTWADSGAPEEGRSVRLGFVGGEAFGVPGRISLNSASDTDVQSGESTTFTLQGTAPVTPGKYRSEWQMVSEGVAWYGPKMWIDFDVQPVPGLDAVTEGQGASTIEVTAGETFAFSFRVKNTGVKAWRDVNAAQEGQAIRLGFLEGEDFGVNHRISVTEASDSDVQPGESTSWTLKGTAPRVPGVYRTQWQPLNEGVAWFGPTLWRDVVVRSKDALLVSLRTQTGAFVAVEQDGNFGVTANRQAQGAWETFALVDHNGGELMSGDVVSFQSVSGLFLSAEQGGGAAVVGNRRLMDSWEKFTIEKRGGGSGVLQPNDPISLRSFNGHYLCAEGGGGAELNATRTGVSQWETFSLGFDLAVRGVQSWPERPDGGGLPSPEAGSTAASVRLGSFVQGVSGCSVVDFSPTGLFAPIMALWFARRRRQP